jgi:hypothetical protein
MVRILGLAGVNDMAKRHHSALGKRLIASAKEMIAHAKGELELEEYEVRLPPHVESDTEHRRRHLVGPARPLQNGLTDPS